MPPPQTMRKGDRARLCANAFVHTYCWACLRNVARGLGSAVGNRVIAKLLGTIQLTHIGRSEAQRVGVMS
eukprot:1629841-Pyramimonas_sp.AAC.1